MPVLSRFYGIIIRMYFIQAEHNPPHIHAIYGDDVADSMLLFPIVFVLSMKDCDYKNVAKITAVFEADHIDEEETDDE